jgi:hypothetical protein
LSLGDIRGPRSDFSCWLEQDQLDGGWNMVSPVRYTSSAIAAAVTLAVLVSHATTARGDEAAAREYVRLALAHQAYGKEEVGRHLLEAALQESPDYAPAHWHLGHVQAVGQWVPAADAHLLVDQNEMLALYRQLRDAALNDPRRELSLAKWCRRQGWREHEDLHYARVALNPASGERLGAEAMRELDLVNVNGELLSEEEVVSLQELAEQVAGAMKKWREPLEEWGRAIVSEDAAEAARAAEELAKVDDPTVIPALDDWLVESGPVFGPHLVALLGRFQQHDSTRALTRFAVLAPWEDVRNRAIDELKRRPMHDYVPLLLDELVAPIRSRYQIIRDRFGGMYYKHILVQRNADGNYVAMREHVLRPFLYWIPGRIDPRERLTSNVTPMDAIIDAEPKVRMAAARAAVRAMKYEERIAEKNAGVMMHNDPILVALEQTSGQMLGRDPADWQAWWQTHNETHTEKPLYFGYYPTSSSYVTYFQPLTEGSCFDAGTPVWTETGLVPVESVEVGDRVLSQDLDSGELTYKLVLRTTALPPTSDTVRVVVDAESVDMTKAHVVWVNGQGWRMAKELEPGDLLHGVGGAKEVDGVDELPPELEVYNLVVADFNTFFVGESGLLVHDITYVTRRRPSTAIVPGFTPTAARERPSIAASPPPASLVRQVQNGLLR